MERISDAEAQAIATRMMAEYKANGDRYVGSYAALQREAHEIVDRGEFDEELHTAIRDHLRLRTPAVDPFDNVYAGKVVDADERYVYQLTDHDKQLVKHERGWLDLPPGVHDNLVGYRTTIRYGEHGPGLGDVESHEAGIRSSDYRDRGERDDWYERWPEEREL